MFIPRNPFDFLEGNSANHAIELLRQKGVPESHIIFLNLISVSYSIPQCWLIYMLLSIINPIHWFLVCYIGFRHLRGYIAFANGSRPWKSSPQRLTCHWMKNSVLFREWGSLVIVTLALTIDLSSSKSRNYVYNWMKLDTCTARWNIKPACISGCSAYSYNQWFRFQKVTNKPLKTFLDGSDCALHYRFPVPWCEFSRCYNTPWICPVLVPYSLNWCSQVIYGVTQKC